MKARDLPRDQTNKRKGEDVKDSQHARGNQLRRSTRTTKRVKLSLDEGAESDDDVDVEGEAPASKPQKRQNAHRHVNMSSKAVSMSSARKNKATASTIGHSTQRSAIKTSGVKFTEGQDTLKQRSKHVGKKLSPGNGQLDYTLTAPEPWRDHDRQWRFDDHPTFLPNLSPEEVIRQGSFGGGYFRPVYSNKSKRELHDDWEDLPREWFDGLEVSEYLTREEGSETAINKWKVKVGQSYEEWEKANWIVPQHDARGWFQWYCRFWRGRRVPQEDERQIGRWERLAGESGRWRRIFYGKYLKMGLFDIDAQDEPASKGIRQTLNHWAYEPSTTHLLEFLDSKGIDVANDEAAGDLV
ncbi:hypothetical protein OIO90_003131 [Microbotryomycetes sp. JL221]|nr:hypothetical protein OIO90_003131 [Microbotryomycetes sp. JL221]